MKNFKSIKVSNETYDDIMETKRIHRLKSIDAAWKFNRLAGASDDELLDKYTRLAVKYAELKSKISELVKYVQ